MKKTILTIAILFGMFTGAFAQGGLFGMGPERQSESYDYSERGGMLSLPSSHGNDQDESPLGSGALLLIGFGAAYALKKKKD